MKKRTMGRALARLLAICLLLLPAVPCAAAQDNADTFTLTEKGSYAEPVTSAGGYELALYSQISPVAQDIYNALVANTETMVNGTSPIRFTFREWITRDMIRFSDYADAVSAFTRDHSEVFWVTFSKLKLSITEDAQTGLLQGEISTPAGNYYILPYMTAEQVQRDRQALANGLGRALDAVDAEADVYTQLLQMHDWLCANNEYNDQTVYNDMRMFEAVSALDNDPNTKPVCEGYARALKLLCDARGIPCILIEGYAPMDQYDIPHMWNLVFVDGAWYAVDVTWDDSVSWGGPPRHNYFLTGSECYVNSAKFSETHVVDGLINEGGMVFVYPEFSETAYVYAPDAEKTPEEPQEETLLPGFAKIETYKDGLFRDVKAGDWYRDNVALAYALGLMVGNGDGSFNADGEIRVCECVSIAARIHSLYTGAQIPEGTTGLWYDGAVRYALENGILTEECEDYMAFIDRRSFAQILSRALPAEVLAGINTIEDGAIPDVAEDAAIYMLYRAGVLRGDVDGTFHPDTPIRRCEVAAIVTRMADPALRVAFAL